MQSKIGMRALIAFFLFLGIVFSFSDVLAEEVRMRVVLVNPSASKPQTKSIKNYLPKEVTLKDIKDPGGLDIDYDEEQGLFYAYKQAIELAPGETKTFELVMDDVWMIAEERLKDVRTRVERTMEHLKETTYYQATDMLAKTIYGRLDEIVRTQNDKNVSKSQHIAYYRDNLKIMDTVKYDMEKLEKILVAAGGPPNLEVIEESDLNLKSPTSKTTWIVIFVILVFIGVLGGVFYFTWQGQARITENIFKKEKDQSYGDFKPKSGNDKES